MAISRKLVTTIATLLGLLLTDVFGLQLRQETVDAVVEILVWYLGAQGAVDLASVLRNPTHTKAPLASTTEPPAVIPETDPPRPSPPPPTDPTTSPPL